MLTTNPQARLLTLARFIAHKRVREELKANGIRLHCIEPAALNRAVSDYLEVAKAELIEQAQVIFHR
jgi:hypothetical protein